MLHIELSSFAAKTVPFGLVTILINPLFYGLHMRCMFFGGLATKFGMMSAKSSTIFVLAALALAA